MDVAEVLNRFGIPWPDANSDKARQAANAWTAIAAAANTALDRSDKMISELTADNSGPAMSAFTQYWSQVGGTPAECTAADARAMLPVLIQAADALASACNEFADAVDDARRKLTEIAAEIGTAVASGAIATVFTAGVSDLISYGVSGLLIDTGLDAVAVFGTSIESIVSGFATGGLTSLLSSALDASLTNGVKADFGDTTPDDTGIVADLIEGVAFGGIAGAAGRAVTGIARSAAEATLTHLPDSVAALVPDLPTVINAIPDATATPAGQALTKLSTDYAATSALAAAQGKDAEAPGVPEVLGELLDSRIEAAGGSG